MQAKTMRDLGALVRAARVARGMTQADLAHELRVSRDWVVRLEKGHPRLEAQKVLDALLVLGLTLDVKPAPRSPTRKTARSVTTGTWSTKNTGKKPTSTKSTNSRSTSKSKNTGATAAKKPTGATPASVDPFEALLGKKR